MSNYTPEETSNLLDLYTKLGTPGIDKIAAELGKTKKSIIAKLSREKVYIKADKNNTEKITKKILVRKLIELTGKELNGIESADKQSLQDILDHIEDLTERAHNDD